MVLYVGSRGSHASWNFFYGTLDDSHLNLVVATKAFVPSSEGILLVYNTSRGWEIPGGHLEKLETLDQCVRREVYEESGYFLKDLQIYGYLRITNHIQKVNKVTGKYYPPISFIVYYTGKVDGRQNTDLLSSNIQCGFFPINSKEVKNCWDSIFFTGEI